MSCKNFADDNHLPHPHGVQLQGVIPVRPDEFQLSAASTRPAPTPVGHGYSRSAIPCAREYPASLNRRFDVVGIAGPEFAQIASEMGAAGVTHCHNDSSIVFIPLAPRLPKKTIQYPVKTVRCMKMAIGES